MYIYIYINIYTCNVCIYIYSYIHTYIPPTLVELTKKLGGAAKPPRVTSHMRISMFFHGKMVIYGDFVIFW